MSKSVDIPGVSCAICCHNSAARLPATLAALAAQQIPEHIPWEVLVVNNASSDDTAEAARKAWSGSPDQLRVVDEPVPGLSNARLRALAEAQYSILSFIDDDNHVCSDWIAKAFATMEQSEEVGLVGGRNLPLPEVSPPHWFDEVRGFWAVEGTPRPAGDITNLDRFPSGAGLSVRKAAYQALVDDGFEFTLTDRCGKGMGSGGDHEMIMALMLRGWRVYHEPSMVLDHFIPKGRLTWDYAKRLLQGVGEAGASMDAYLYLWMDRQGESTDNFRSHWAWRAAASFRDWAGLLLAALRSGGWKQGNPKMLLAERAKGRFLAILQMRSEYNLRKQNVAAAPWLQDPGKVPA